MTQMLKITPNPTRAAALARRHAMSRGGKAALGAAAPVAPVGTVAAPGNAPAIPTRTSAVAPASGSARTASRQRRQALATFGKTGVTNHDRVRNAKPAAPVAVATSAASPATSLVATPRPAAASVLRRRPVVKLSSSPANTSRAIVLARRKALASGGKAALRSASTSPAQTMRAANPQISSRELAQALRNQRSRTGNAGQNSTPSAGRMRPGRPAVPAQDTQDTNAPAEKSGGVPAGTSAGNSAGNKVQLSTLKVTGTSPGRSKKTTGNQVGTCKSVTGTEYMAAEIFHEFCQTGTGPATPTSTISKGPGSKSLERAGNAVTGNEILPSSKVTGAEAGAARDLTGMQYSSARTGQSPGAHQARHTPKPAREPLISQFISQGPGGSGGGVTGALIGQNSNVTGDEPGKCRIISGDFYIGSSAARSAMVPVAAPVASPAPSSCTFGGNAVTGTMTGRAANVTGHELGTCTAVTGTGYGGAEQYQSFCAPEAISVASARTAIRHATPGAVLTGQQPGIGGKVTGTGRGACEPLSGTPYVGADQFADACDIVAAPAAQNPAAQNPASRNPAARNPANRNVAGNITGTSTGQGQITGPFGLAAGVVTGTPEFHTSVRNTAPVMARQVQAAPQPAACFEGRVKSRISGEGMDSGLNITGDDWDRGDRVTGTEGRSAVQRNPTRRGLATLMSAPVVQPEKRNEELRMAISKVTGASGNTEKGSLITYSGGARG